WLLGFFANRDLSARGSWRLAGAALMPGALFLSGAIVLYGLGGLDPIQLAAAAGAHLLIGWIYIIAGVLAVSRHPEAGLKNPFVQRRGRRRQINQRCSRHAGSRGRANCVCDGQTAAIVALFAAAV